MPTEAERKRLRSTFDAEAERYERVRPDYPEELLDHLVAVSGLRPGDALLEVGAGTGKATRQMVARGLRVTCIEMGANLAAVARRSFAAEAIDVEVIETEFERWRPRAGERFDMVVAATAWHWIDPALRYRRAWEALRPGGHLAFWNAVHVFPEDGDPLFAEMQPLYDEIGESGPSLVLSWPRPGELEELGAEIEASGRFDVVAIRHFDWERVYDAADYVDLLRTFSRHAAMAPWKRALVEGETRRRLEMRPDRRVRRHWGAVLHVARRRG